MNYDTAYSTHIFHEINKGSRIRIGMSVLNKFLIYVVLFINAINYTERNLWAIQLFALLGKAPT